MKTIIIKNTEPCFEHVLGLVISHVTYSIGMAVYMNRDLSAILDDKKIYYPGTIGTTNLELDTKIKEKIVEISQKRKWPEQIEFECSKLGTKKVNMEHSWKVEKSDVFGEWQAISSYVPFYDKIEDKINSKYGKNNHQNWPEIFNFARIMRNALAHGNKIYFINENSKSFSWRNIEYGPNNNGRKVVFQDFLFADLILLMKDINDSE